MNEFALCFAHSFNQFILHNSSVVLMDVALLPILEGKKKNYSLR